MRSARLWISISLSLVALIGCSASHSVTIPDQIVKEQVTNCLKSKRSPGGTAFDEEFEILDVRVKDRLIKDRDAKIIYSLSFRPRRDYMPDNPLSDDRLIWGGLVGTRAGKRGETITNDLEATFERFEQGWRIVCGN